MRSVTSWLQRRAATANGGADAARPDASGAASSNGLQIAAGQVTTLEGHTNEVFICAWSPTANMLASGCALSPASNVHVPGQSQTAYFSTLCSAASAADKARRASCAPCTLLLSLDKPLLRGGSGGHFKVSHVRAACPATPGQSCDAGDCCKR